MIAHVTFVIAVLPNHASLPSPAAEAVHRAGAGGAEVAGGREDPRGDREAGRCGQARPHGRLLQVQTVHVSSTYTVYVY